MQQTRVAQGLPYFEKFYKELPTIQKFAAAEQDFILNLWQGLGYYSRARNMHFAANQIMTEFEGEFPPTFKELKKLKGVGDYTAAAIASIAFNEPKAVVDGNVYRVLARLFDVDLPIDSSQGKKYFQKLADELIDPETPGDYNQAIMDFGAMVCTPKSPSCSDCPLQSKCVAHAKKTVDQLPVKAKKVRVTDRYFQYYELEAEGCIVLQQRTGKDIWNGLYQLPLIEVKDEKIKAGESVYEMLEKANASIEKMGEAKHILSHQRLWTTFYRIDLGSKIDLPDDYIWVKKSDISKFAFPKLIINYFNGLDKN
jgi:A/G-specific adenine glycosylase